MDGNPLALLPEMLLLAGAVATLATGSCAPRPRQWLARLPAVAALLGAVAAAAVLASGGERTSYAGTYALDGATAAARVVAPSAALLVLLLSVPRVRGDRRESEFAVLVLLATLGSVLLAGSADLLVLAVAYLLATIPLYALAGWGRDPRAAESALKLYLLGALLGIVLLLGVAVLYGLAGGTGYGTLAQRLTEAPAAGLAAGTVAVLAGLLFKAGAVPAHFWVPDAAAGAAVPAAAFLTTVPKVGALLALYRLASALPESVVDWRLLVGVLAAASMALGNLAAFAQTDPLRLLGYSTVSQVGYLLMATAVADRPGALPALALYLAAYAVTNLGPFAVVAALPQRRTLAAYRGMGRRHPWLAGSLAVCLLGLVGTPPTAVFAGKLTVFAATWDGGFAWLAVVAAGNTVASLFYYLRWLAPVFAPEETPAEQLPSTGPWPAATAVGAAAVALALGPAAQVVLGRW